jgi:hypothetical protein
MKNASIQVNAEKRIVNVGLRLFSLGPSVARPLASDHRLQRMMNHPKLPRQMHRQS